MSYVFHLTDVQQKFMAITDRVQTNLQHRSLDLIPNDSEARDSAVPKALFYNLGGRGFELKYLYQECRLLGCYAVWLL
jgi:hypothetical protein